MKGILTRVMLGISCAIQVSNSVGFDGEGASCVLEPRPKTVISADEFYNKIPKDERRVDKETFLHALSQLPPAIEWDTPIESAIYDKMRHAELVVSGILPSFDELLWESSDLSHIISVDNVVMDVQVQRIYKKQKLIGSKTIPNSKHDKNIKIQLSTLLLYVPSYDKSVATLYREVTDHYKELSELRQSLHDAHANGKIGKSELAQRLKELRQREENHEYGEGRLFPAVFRLDSYVNPEFLLCGLEFLRPEHKYVFFLDEVEPNLFRLAGKQSVLPQSFEAAIDKVENKSQE